MKPLAGIRVLCVESFGAGPYGSMALADLGAEVIKLENPAEGGDGARKVGPHLLGAGDSQYFQTWNQHKKSVALDLKSEDGRAAFRRLVATADALTDNLRGDQPERLGLTYAQLAPINPRLVCLHISAYGRDNARKARPGYDYLMQAEAGLMALTGEPDGPPERIGVSMIDYMTGMTGTVGLLACLLRAKTTGQGCDVDVALFDVALHQLGYAGLWYLNQGDVARRQRRSGHLSMAPVQTFPTADGWIYVMCMTDKFWRALAEGVGHAEWTRDARFAASRARFANRAALSDLLDAVFKTRPTAEWIALLGGSLPVAPVYGLDRALDSDHVRAVGMIGQVDHRARPGLRVLHSPLKIDGKRPKPGVGPALGQHDAEILKGG
ncbi:MAG: CoA transferase [Alphaproteobacteria bacterium]|nr:CoA transferase [Alphaproteobacteria bacterium]